MQREWREALNSDQKKRLRSWEKKLETHDAKAKEARREIDKLYRISLTNQRRRIQKASPDESADDR